MIPPKEEGTDKILKEIDVIHKRVTELNKWLYEQFTAVKQRITKIETKLEESDKIKTTNNIVLPKWAFIALLFAILALAGVDATGLLN